MDHFNHPNFSRVMVIIKIEPKKFIPKIQGIVWLNHRDK